MISVIGGSGFIGTRLCRLLSCNDRKFMILDKQVSYCFSDNSIIADIRDKSQLKKYMSNVDVIINLAAEHRDDVLPRSLYDEVNVTGSMNICQAARECDVNKIIFISSVAVYGFASPNTDESGKIKYFNDYGRTKWLAEEIYTAWQNEDPQVRSLTIIRPTVVFGEQNRGNVFNLLNQVSKNKFVMIGKGKNIKSMAYVENVAAFIERSLDFGSGVHIYNYVDKPDMDMNALITLVRSELSKGPGVGLRIPYMLGLMAGYLFDFFAFFMRRKYPISSIRVKKFCGTTQFNTSITPELFVPPVGLIDGLRKTIDFEFKSKTKAEHCFYTE